MKMHFKRLTFSFFIFTFIFTFTFTFTIFALALTFTACRNSSIFPTSVTETEQNTTDTEVSVVENTTEDTTAANTIPTTGTDASQSTADTTEEITENTTTATRDTENTAPTSAQPVPTTSHAPSGTAVSLHGRLHVTGANLVDKNGNNFQLYGMSTHGIAWFPQYVSYDTFKTLRDDWNVNCIRLAMYTAEYGGYCTGGDKNGLKSLIRDGVRYATDLGLYVIIDWHVLNDRDPNVYKNEAVDFFREMSAQYANYDNVIYEICNEPNSGPDWNSIKNYANEIIPVIRSNDSDAVIIVGTPVWSQEIDKALSSPLQFDNVMYALHFYAATHTDWLRDRVEYCVTNGLPVFISEFGLCDASGNGGNDFRQADEWFKLMDRYNLSHCCWNLANKAETSSVINSWCNKTSDWSTDDLSEAGKWIRNRFRSNLNR